MTNRNPRRPASRPGAAAGAVLRRAAISLSAALAAACGDSSGPGDGNGNNDPPVVASVDVAAAATSVEVGGVLQLTATARDAQGNVIAGRTVTWSSTNQGVAQVTAAGLVNGVAAGSATINATVDGRTGGLQITVTAPPPVILSAISPNPLVPGQSATLTGSGFSTVPAANAVTIGGTAAAVTSAAPTSLTVTVPPTLCAPPGPVQVLVTVSGRASNPLQQQAQTSGTTVNAAVGQMQFLQSNFCLQFGASAASESYLIGVQSYNETVATVTPVRVGMSTLGPAPSTGAAALAFPVAAGESPVLDPARSLRWARHRAAEHALRTLERAAVPAPAAALPGAADVALAIPAVVNVGDNVTVRVPDRTNLCNGFTEITTVVRAVGAKSVWLEDTGNPAGGFSAGDYQNLVSQFDNLIYAADVAYFGQPTDIDGNGRIVIVITKEINKSNILGFTTNADLRPRTQCPSSDFSEIYYNRAPDPTGSLGEAYTLAAALADAPQLLAHEFTHILQFTTRGTNPLPRVWEMEGQATFAEEIVGHAMTGRSPGQNYGFDVAFNCVPGSQPCADAGGIAWYIGAFVDMALYYGFDPDAANPQQTPVDGAPEQCSWLDLASSGNGGPCYSGREVYGVPWLLLRYLSDQYGSRFAGGEQELQRQLIAGNRAGFDNIAFLTGRAADQVLAEWAAALYIDDRLPGADSRLTFTSWNLVGIENRLVNPARLRPRNRTFSAFNDDVSVRAGSTAYFLVSGARAASALRMRGTGETTLPAHMRVWVVRMQ